MGVRMTGALGDSLQEKLRGTDEPKVTFKPVLAQLNIRTPLRPPEPNQHFMIHLLFPEVFVQNPAEQHFLLNYYFNLEQKLKRKQHEQGKESTHSFCQMFQDPLRLHRSLKTNFSRRIPSGAIVGSTFLQVLAWFTVILLLKVMNVRFAVYRIHRRPVH